MICNDCLASKRMLLQIVLLLSLVSFVEPFVVLRQRSFLLVGQRRDDHHHDNLNQQSSSNAAPLFAISNLPSALEWLSVKKELGITWVDPVTSFINKQIVHDEKSPSTNSNNEVVLTVPLYPLDACYIPVGGQDSINEIDDKMLVTLRNTEPRNVKMALDLMKQKEEEQNDDNGNDTNARFCAVLRAHDTGKIATVGTILRIESFDIHYLWDKKTIARIILQCIPEKRVQILNILNPSAWSRENRLFQLDEYLMTEVISFDDVNMNMIMNGEKDGTDYSIGTHILLEYESIRKIYATETIVTKDLPPFALESLSSLPQMESIHDETSFWAAVNVWQLLCSTIKEAWRVNLRSIVDEKTISAAVEKGGPLNLPVHRGDLPFDVRMELDQLENRVFNDFIAINMEPNLLFQQILSTKSISQRLELFSDIIINERKRLERIIENDDERA